MNNDKYQGARFYKCALQVNPCTYGPEYRGQPSSSEEDYNEEVLQQCEHNNIEVVGLADHGGVEDSEGLRKLLRKNGLTVFPGFEISSSEGIHMVCLYPERTPMNELHGYLGQLMGDNFSKLQSDQTCKSTCSCKQIAEQVLNKQGGFLYAAHMTGDGGILKLSLAGGRHKELWKDSQLIVAGQIPGRIEDSDKYRQIIENKNPDYKRETPIAIINAKDIYKPETLSDPSASCLVKMTRPGLEAFKQAFHDPESRIRLNHDSSEQSYSFINSILWEGAGFFKKDKLVFSKRLNAVIGGRGTGKSTLVESIRYVLDQPAPEKSSKALSEFHKSNLGDSQITLYVTSKAQSGQRYTISKRFGESAIVKNEQGGLSRLTPQDILPGVRLLGQNEILEIEKDDTAKLKLINSFLPDGSRFDKNLEEIKWRMAKNRDKRVKADEEFERLKDVVQKESGLIEQQDHFKKLGIEQKLKNVKLLEKEKNIQEDIEQQIERVEQWLKRYEEVFDLLFLQEARIGSLPNKTILAEARKIFERLKGQLDEYVVQAGKDLENATNEHSKLKEKWQSEVAKINDELQQAISQLPEQAGKTGKELGRKYADIIRELAQIDRQKSEYTRQESLIKELDREREVLLEEYRDTAFERFDALNKAARKLNQDDLKGKMKLTVERFGNLQPLKDFLLDIGGIGEAKVKWLDETRSDKTTDLDLSAWSKWIRGRNIQAFMDKYESYGMQKRTAEKLATLSLKKRLELEEIELQDTIEIELNLAHGGEKDYRPLENLSTGQKCTAILNLLLLNLDEPLIIDQPEDNLDNAFIADRIVRDLRKFKNRRQFIFATHNANIPVFGDAELIAVLHSDKDGGKVKETGSIDKPGVRERVAEILEGGKAAFEMRRNKYGY